MSEKRTLVEEGTSFNGIITSTVPIQVNGRVDGEVDAPSLQVTPSGIVHGKVRVTSLVSAGEIAGQIKADELKLSGSVKDNTQLEAKSLEVKLASDGGTMQVYFGNVQLAIGGEPDRS